MTPALRNLATPAVHERRVVPAAEPARRFEVVANARAGGGCDADWARALEHRFGEGGVQARVHLAGDGAAIDAAVRRAVAARPDALVAAGGDGTINTIARAALDAGLPLGVLPLGTLNHFAKDLGMPVDVDAAVAALARARPRAVDVGEVGDRIFLNNASVGLYPEFVKRRHARERLGWRKWPAAMVAAARTFVDCPRFDAALEVDGHRLVRNTAVVFIGNNEYRLDGLALGARDRLDGGVLGVYFAPDKGAFGLLKLAFRALLGRLEHGDEFEHHPARELRIGTRQRRVRVATDGEIGWMRTPLEFRIRPGALTVLAPAEEPPCT